MEKEEKMEMKKGGIINFFDGATINNLVINGNMTKSGTEHFCSRNADMKEEEETDSNKILTPDQLAKAVGKVLNLFWGKSSYAVLFCVCRDYFGYPNNMSMFESEFADLFNDVCPHYKCSHGTIVSAFFNNSFLKLPVEKWKENGAKQRALLLADNFKAALSESYLTE